MVQQFTAVRLEVGEKSGGEDEAENVRIIQELDREEHQAATFRPGLLDPRSIRNHDLLRSTGRPRIRRLKRHARSGVLAAEGSPDSRDRRVSD